MFVKFHHWLQFLLVMIGCVILGYFLGAYEVAWWMWAITFIAVAYVVFVDKGGLLLSNVWVLLLCGLGIYQRRWPSTWPVVNPQNPAAQRAIVFLCIWGAAVAILVLIASTSEVLQQRGFSRQTCLRYLGFGVTLSMLFGGSLHWLGILS